MKPKHKRMVIVASSLVIMGLAATLLLKSFQDNLIFFYTPTQWQAKAAAPDFIAPREMRIGGIVKQGSIAHDEGTMHFTITDMTHEMAVTYRGMVPSLFREGQGVVAQGRFDGGVFRASTILAKHDENYMPKEVVDQLKQSGRWQE